MRLPLLLEASDVLLAIHVASVREVVEYADYSEQDYESPELYAEQDQPCELLYRALAIVVCHIRLPGSRQYESKGMCPSESSLFVRL